MDLRVIAWLASASLCVSGCFPPPPDKDSDDTASGSETSQAGDTGPQPDTATPPDDTITPDTTARDTTPPECDGPEDCGHLAGTCTRVVCLGGSCAAQPATGGSCDDGNACTKDDVCSGFSCAGTAYGCDDGEACTDDACDGAGGCDYPAGSGFCRIAGACYTAGDTKPGDPCRICTAGETWSPNDGAPCSDGDDVCTLADTCTGTQCVGGGPPEDSAGNWVTNVVSSTSPQYSVGRAVEPISLDDWAIFVSIGAAGTVPTSAGDIDVDGNALVIVRRSPSSTWIQAMATASDEVSLGATASTNGAVAWAVELAGTGHISADVESISKDDAGTTHYVGSTDKFGFLRYLAEAYQEPDGLAVLTDGRVLQAYRAVESYIGSDGSSHSVDTPGDSETAVVRYDYAGIPDWGGVIKTPAFSPGAAGLCTLPDGSAAVVAPFRGSASVALGSSALEVNAANANTTYFVARFGEGTETVGFAPLAFSIELQTSLRLGSPLLFCDSDGATMAFHTGGHGRVAAFTNSVATLGVGGGSIIRVGWDGTVEWALNVTGALVGHGSAGTLTLASSSYISGPTKISTVAGDSLYDADSAAAGTLFQVAPNGDLLWAHDVPPMGSAVTLGVRVRPNTATPDIALTGSFLGGALDVTPLGAPELLAGAADVNAFAALLNSAAALSCAPAISGP